jgi:hypothetical protein
MFIVFFVFEVNGFGNEIFLQKAVFAVKGSNIWVVGQFEMAGARTVPVRSGWQRRSLENSPVAFIVKCAADGDRPRSGQTDPLPNIWAMP